VKEFSGIADLFAEVKRNFRSSSTFVDWSASYVEDGFVQSPSQQNSWNIGLFNDCNVCRNAGYPMTKMQKWISKW
jgi:hypothetical protein